MPSEPALQIVTPFLGKGIIDEQFEVALRILGRMVRPAHLLAERMKAIVKPQLGRRHGRAIDAWMDGFPV